MINDFTQSEEGFGYFIMDLNEFLECRQRTVCLPRDIVLQSYEKESFGSSETVPLGEAVRERAECGVVVPART